MTTINGNRSISKNDYDRLEGDTYHHHNNVDLTEELLSPSIQDDDSDDDGIYMLIILKLVNIEITISLGTLDFMFSSAQIHNPPSLWNPSKYGHPSPLFII